MNSKTTNRILSHQEIQFKIRRIAYQIYEINVHEQEVVIAGIAPNGHILAERIAATLKEISELKIILCKLEVNSEKPTEIKISIPPEMYTGKSVVLIDDVLNSGRTLIYGIRHFLSVPLKRFKTAVLVNRNHKEYPVKADFKGISLSTSLNEHVRVILSESGDAVFLE